MRWYMVMQADAAMQGTMSEMQSVDEADGHLGAERPAQGPDGTHQRGAHLHARYRQGLPQAVVVPPVPRPVLRPAAPQEQVRPPDAGLPRQVLRHWAGRRLRDMLGGGGQC